MTPEPLKSEARAAHLCHSQVRSCTEEFNPHLPSVISDGTRARWKTEIIVLQKIGSLYYESLFNLACPCMEMQEEHPPRTGQMDCLLGVSRGGQRRQQDGPSAKALSF